MVRTKLNVNFGMATQTQRGETMKKNQENIGMHGLVKMQQLEHQIN